MSGRAGGTTGPGSSGRPLDSDGALNALDALLALWPRLADQRRQPLRFSADESVCQRHLIGRQPIFAIASSRASGAGSSGLPRYADLGLHGDGLAHHLRVENDGAHSSAPLVTSPMILQRPYSRVSTTSGVPNVRSS